MCAVHLQTDDTTPQSALGSRANDGRKPWDCWTEGAVSSCSPSCQLQCHSQRMQEGQRWQQALEVLDEMRGSMLQHNVVTYIATISA